MSREILFRAWDKSKEFDGVSRMIKPMTLQQWIGNVDIEYTSDEMMSIYEFGWEENLIFMQYTGLTDKNGTKIFEGDIVRYNYRMSEYVNVPIAFRDSRFCFDIKPYQFGENFVNILPTYGLEVIGNVYENENLLIK